MASLYEINAQIEAVLDRLYEEVDEETGEVSEDVLGELETLKAERDAKLDNIGAYIKNLEADVTAIKAEMDNLKKRKEVKERKIERLKEYVKQDLMYHGEAKKETARAAYSFRTSKKVEITDEALIPKDFITEVVEYKVDKTKIKETISTGTEVPGAQIVENKNLQIK